MSGLPLSMIIDVDVSITGAATPKLVWTPLIADEENRSGSVGGAAVVDEYSSAAEMLDDGYETYNKAYKIAQFLFAQEPHPATVKIGGMATGVEATDMADIEDADPNWYGLLYTSRVAADIKAMAAWVESSSTYPHFYMAETNDAAAKAAGVSVLTDLHALGYRRTACVYRDRIPQVVILRIDTALIAANSTICTVNGVSTAAEVYGVSHNATMGAIATKIAALAMVDTAVSSVSPQQGLGAVNHDIITLTALDSMVDLEAACVTTLGASQASWAPEESVASQKPVDSAIMGLQIAKDPGTSTWAHKTLAGGILADALNTGNVAVIRNSNGNFYAEVGGSNRFLFGTCVGDVAPNSPLFIDLQILADAIKADIEAALNTLLANSEKVPYTDAGIASVIAALVPVGNKYQERGAIQGPADGRTFANTYSYPTRDSIAAADVTARVLNGISVRYISTGGIHIISNVAVNLAA